MKANLFSILFETFDLEERKRFETFLNSPYFNKSSIVTRLFEIHLGLEPAYIDYATIWKHLYPEKPLAENQLRKHYSDLHRLARKFLVVEELSHNGRTESLLLLNRFRSTISANRLRKEVELAQNELPSHAADYPDTESYGFASQLNEYSYFLDIHERKVLPSLADAIRSLDASYFLAKLKYLCEIASFRNVLKYELHFLLESEILQIVSKPPFSQYLLIRIYVDLLTLFKSHKMPADDQQSSSEGLLEIYEKLIETVRDNHVKIAMSELQTVQNLLQNFCIQRIAALDERFESKLDELYEFRLQNESIFIKGWLRSEDFKNRTSLLLRLKKYPQAWNFIHQYAERVLPEFRESAKHFNLGNYYYHMADFGKMRKELIVILHHDSFYHLDTKALMIKAYFWEHEIEPLKLQLDSLKTYLRRNSKLPPDRLSAHFERYRFFEKLYRLMEKKVLRNARIDKLRAEIEGCHKLIDKQFLLDLLKKWQQEFSTA